MLDVFSGAVFGKLLVSLMLTLAVAIAHKENCCARVLANGRKYHSIPLIELN